MLSTITVLALAAAAQAAPVSSLIGTPQFSVPAVKNPNYQRNGTAAMLKAYAKHNLTPTRPMPSAFNNLRKRQDGSVPADTSGGVEYLIQVNIGGQDLNLDLDTGSADLWVFSNELPSADCSSHTCYSPSSSYQALDGATWSISYADGSSSSGDAGTDTVTVGGTTVNGQCVELASQVSSAFESGAGDGLIGMAFSSINTVTPQQQNTFFANAAGSLDSPIFCASLPQNADGEYDFGYTDSSKYSGDIQYTNVDSSNGFWEFSSPSYSVGSSSYSQSNSGIADTGTTLLLMGDDAVDNYYGAVSGASYNSNQGGYTFSCDATLPDLSISIGDNTATVPGSLINFQTLGDGTCFGGLQSVGSGSMNIYGDVFFNAVYAVFDNSVPQFGFAPAA